MRRRRVPGAGDMLLRLISTNLGGEQRARTVWVQPSIIEADRIARPELVPDIGGAGDLAGVLPDRRARLPQPRDVGTGIVRHRLDRRLRIIAQRQQRRLRTVSDPAFRIHQPGGARLRV